MASLALSSPRDLNKSSWKKGCLKHFGLHAFIACITVMNEYYLPWPEFFGDPVEL
jgi:hypothetical protein